MSSARDRGSSSCEGLRSSRPALPESCAPAGQRRGPGIDRGDPAGGFDLALIADRHEAQQDMGHAEVAKAPGEGGDDGDEAVLARGGGDDARVGEKA